jgi:hypothetical protein
MFDTRCGPDNIDNRIRSPHLVKVHVRDVDPVYFALGFGQTAKHLASQLFDPRGKSAFREHRVDACVVAMRLRLSLFDAKRTGTNAVDGPEFEYREDTFESEAMHRFFDDPKRHAQRH